MLLKLSREETAQKIRGLVVVVLTASLEELVVLVVQV